VLLGKLLEGPRPRPRVGGDQAADRAAARTARIIRDGIELKVPTRDVLHGDIVIVRRESGCPWTAT